MPLGPPALRLSACCVLVLAACGDPSGREVFEAEAVPVLEASCGAPTCHGVAPGAEDAGEVVDWSLFFFPVDARGRVSDVDVAYEAALRARGDAVDPDAAPLLRKPLSTSRGGLAHFGGENFGSRDDAGYRAIHDWLGAEPLRDPPPPLTDRERLFRETVQPALIGAMCANGSCHGVDAAVPYHVDPGPGGVIGPSTTRRNYAQALSMLSLDGDPGQSRLLRKALPLHDGGIVHKGGNLALLESSDGERARAIREWACAEREARLGAACLGPGEPPIDGFVFVRGPLAPRGAFDLDTWSPGTDVWLARVEDTTLTPASLENLTRRLHDGTGDARDPAVGPRGRRVLFALRTGADRGHRIHELDLETGDVRVLTAGDGAWSDRDPRYGPNGRVWFVSDRAGVVADGGALLDAELYSLDPATGEVVRRTFTPHIERKPIFLVHGMENGGEVAFTALRDAVPSRRRAHAFRFPPDLETEYHQHFGITAPETLFWDTRELPDGRYVAVLGSLDGVWRAGRLGVFDRNFGPELPAERADEAPSLPGYRPPLTRLDPAAAAEGVTETLYRDPVALPDGRLLVARADGPVDLEDPTAEPDLRIDVLTLAESPDGSGPRIVAAATLVDEPGVADRDAEPLFVRRPAPVSEGEGRDPEAVTGVLRHQGLPIIDALLRNLPPAGVKTLRDDLRSVRLVEALPATPAERRPIPAEETLFGLEGATSASLTHHGPARILAELRLAADGSFHVEAPAGVPFRLQGLDADGMAVGAVHNRWFYLEPGQVLNQGVLDEDVYAARCAACHGALDGEPAHAFTAPEPDALTTASLTLARYEGQDPRRPIPPTPVGAATRVEVDFRADVRSILDRSCATGGCHAGADPAAGLDLGAEPTTHFDVGYEHLLAPDPERQGQGLLVDVLEGRARESFLVEKLTGRELDAPRALVTPGEPHPAGAPLTDAELRTVIRWIELGATWTGATEGAP